MRYFKSIITVALGTLSSRIFGFVRNALISAYFGTQDIADVLYIILVIPNTIRRLLADGSLDLSFIPLLVRSHEKDPSSRQAKRLVRNIVALQLFVVIPVCLVGMLFPQLFSSLFIRFPEPEKMAIATSMMRIVMPLLFFMSVNSILIAIFDSHRRFFLPSILPVLVSVIVITALILGHDKWSAYSVLYGFLGGTILQTVILLIPLLKMGYSFLPSFNRSFFKEIGINWFPVWITAIMVALMQQVANYFASMLETGSVSALSYSLLFFQLPYGLFYASVAKVTLPIISQKIFVKDFEGIKNTLKFGFESLFVLLTSSSFLLIICAEEIVSVVLQRGAFSYNDTILTANVLKFYSLGIVFTGLYNFLQRFFIAAESRKIIIYSSIAIFITDVIFSLLFLKPLQINGIALANTLAYLLAIIVLYLVNIKRYGNFLSLSTLSILLKVILSLIFAGGVHYLLINYALPLNWWKSGSSWINFLWLTIDGGSMLLIILAIFYFTGLIKHLKALR